MKIKRPVMKEVELKIKGTKDNKKDAWGLLSLCIRLEGANFDGLCRCITCGVIKHWKEMQASHFVPGRGNGILFDERGLYNCCYGCNVCKSGNLHYYSKFLEGRIGVDETRELRDELIIRSKKAVKITTGAYHDKIISYIERIKIQRVRLNFADEDYEKMIKKFDKNIKCLLRERIN